MINHQPPYSETSSICSDAADISDDKSKGLQTTNGSTKSTIKLKSRIPEKISIPTRRKSKLEREKELAQMKLDAMNQIENTIKITDMVKERDSKLTELQSENRNLRKDLGQLRYQLDESNNINKELVEKLHAANNARTQHKIDSENQRTHDLVDVTLSPNVSYDRYLKDIINSRDILLDQNNRLKAELERSRNQITELKETIEYLESMSDSKMVSANSINDSNIDLRSKSELLQIIRSNIDDKIIWMEYGIKLTQAAVQTFPELLKIDKKVLSSKEKEGFCCESEAKWAPFAISLLQKVNASDPNLVQSMINSSTGLTSELLHRKIHKKKNN